MSNILSLKIQSDNSLILAIIAINMTVIGLTSLAESKSIIGIDYGKFLIKKYKVFGLVKIYYLLIIFAAVNIVAVLSLFFYNSKVITVVFIVLVLSLIFGIYYFFAYILVANKLVSKQIYIQELLGLYYDSDNETTFEVDKLVKMSNGSRTNKKIAGDIINYFNTFNGESQKSFCEIFGPESIIYKNTKNLNRKRKKIVDAKPYVYRQGENGVFDISHEFFQLFRFTDLQDKWVIDILRIINKDDCVDRKFDKIRLYNVARVITHINVFGYNEAIYKYKFLEYYIESFYNAIKISKEELSKINSEEKANIVLVEKYTINQIFIYIIKTIDVYKDINFINASKEIIKGIAFNCKYKYFGAVGLEERFQLFLDNVINYDKENIKEIFTELLSEIHSIEKDQDIPKFMKIEKVKKYINDYSSRRDTEKKLKVDDIW